MKNYRLVFIVLVAFILSGCGLAKGVAGIALMPVQLATAVVDGATGGKMNLLGKLNNGVNEAFKPGSKMDSQAMKKAFSGSTFYAVPYTVFLKDDGTALLKQKKNDRIEQVKWTTSTGQLCINNDCYEIRVKDKELLINSAYYKKGDTESFSSKLEAQLKQEVINRAEAERKKAEEKVAQQKAEAEQKLAQQKADAEEKRCQASARCRTQKEKEQRERAAAEQRRRERACDRLYVGKTVVAGELCFFGCVDLKGTIIGLSKENGVATARITSQHRHGETVEKSCSEF